MVLNTGYAPALAYIGFSKESTQGTAAAPTTFQRWTGISEAQPKITPDFRRSGYSRDVGTAVKKLQVHDVKYTGWMYCDSTAAFLNFLLGGSDTVTGSGDPYQHTFNEVENPAVYCSVEHSMGNGLDVARTVDAMPDECEVNCVAGDIVAVTYGWKARYGVPQTSLATVSLETDRPMTYGDGSLSFGSGLTVVTADVTSVKMTFKNGVNQKPAIGAITPRIVVPGARQFDFEFVVIGTTKAPHRDVFYDGDAGTAVVPAITSLATFTPTFDLGGSPDHQISIQFSNINLFDAKPLYAVNADTFTWTVKGTLVRSSASATMCAVTASNGASAAYV